MACKSRLTRQIHAEINMIPLIDVMLVLLVVFMVTAPLMSHSVRIRLPHTVAPANAAPPAVIRLGIDRDGHLSWNNQGFPTTELETRLDDLARTTPQAAIHLYADRQTPYEPIARVMAQAARAGISRIGFESLPQTTGQ